MKHLFIINPVAHKVKGWQEMCIKEIHEFFGANSHLQYDIHITRWERDALGYVMRYAVKEKEPIRVHSIGGSSTLCEIVNAVIDIPEVQIAAYPMGRNNCFLRYFGMDKLNTFMSLKKQVLADVVPMDAMRCGINYGIAFGAIGVEAIADRDGTEMLEKNILLPEDTVYIWAGLKNALKNRQLGQKYTIDLDGQRLDGKYATILIANGPCYGKNLNPAIEAHPNDGILDIYLARDMSRFKYITTAPIYVSGGYQKLSGLISHYRCKKISVSSESVMCVCIDGGTYYEDSIEYEVIEGVINFACPEGIELDKIPRIYGGAVN
ncbi:MAG: hypothetical protein LBD23_18900 [Oscillospiraceae bacterium]|nr:hypothetical protein [Oscillospiraceae bacterium]